jgi:hypothetical protein
MLRRSVQLLGCVQGMKGPFARLGRMGERLNWSLLWVLWFCWPRTLVVAVAVGLTGHLAAAAVVVAIAGVMAAGGYRARDQRRSPA